ncbi:hypothetical protein D3C78_1900330 [compost metagenome]
MNERFAGAVYPQNHDLGRCIFLVCEQLEVVGDLCACWCLQAMEVIDDYETRGLHVRECFNHLSIVTPSGSQLYG